MSSKDQLMIKLLSNNGSVILMVIGNGERHNGEAHWKMLGRRFFHGRRVQLLITRSTASAISTGRNEFLPPVTLPQLLL